MARKSIGSFKGVELFEGEDVAKRVAEINAGASGTGESLGSFQGVEIFEGEDVGARVREIKKPAKKFVPQSVVTKAGSTEKKTPEFDFGPEQSADRINKFNAALNVAIDQARGQRQDTVLDYLGGVIPTGALPATSFAGVLGAFSASAAPLESTLIRSASEFAQDQALIVQEQRNNIRDLALAVAEAGGSQEAVNAVLATSDPDSAISVAAGSLKSTKDDIRQIGSNLVRVTDDGEVEVLFSASAGGGGGGAPTPTTVPTGGFDVSGGFDPIGAKTKDLKEEVKKMFASDFASQLIIDLTDEQLRLFIQDFIDAQNKLQQSIDPVTFYEEWKVKVGLEKESSESRSESNPYD